MFDKQAIEKLQENAAIKSLNSIVDDCELSRNVVLAPQEFTLHDLEKFSVNRSRFRGNVTTSSIESFAAYSATHAADGAAVFIDANTMKAKLFIDIGNKERPGHCEHTASITLEKTAAYVELLKIVGERKSQKEIAEFIEDWRANLRAWTEEDDNGFQSQITIVKALHAVRKITIEAKSASDSEVRNFGSTSTSMDSIDVKSADMPPAFFHFTCEPYAGLASREFILRLSVITDRSPALVLRIVKAEEHKEEMAKEFQNIIESSISEEIKSYVGNFTS